MICNYAYCWKPGCSVYHEAHMLCLCFVHHFVEEPIVFDTSNTTCGKESPERHARRNKNLCRCYILLLWQTCSEDTIFGLNSFQSCLTEISCNPILHVVYSQLFCSLLIYLMIFTFTYALHTLTRRIKYQNPLFDSYSVANK